jgi:biotin synthase-like enzyme
MNFRKSKNKWTTEEVRKILEEKPIHQTGFFDANQQQLLHNNNGVKIDLDGWLALKQGNNKPSRFTNA